MLDIIRGRHLVLFLSPQASLGEGRQMIQNRILISSLVWLSWQLKEKPKKILKDLLLQNYWPGLYETSSEASVWYGEQTIQNRNLISPLLLWLPWQPIKLTLKLILKIFEGLLNSCLQESYETLSELSVWFREQTIQKGILISSLCWQPKKQQQQIIT